MHHTALIFSPSIQHRSVRIIRLLLQFGIDVHVHGVLPIGDGTGECIHTVIVLQGSTHLSDACDLTLGLFGPDGSLYATESMGGSLLVIDMDSLEGTELGALDQHIPDITFVGSRLIGWTEAGDDAVEIDTATGSVTVLGSSSESTAQTGLAADSSGTVYLLESGVNGKLMTVDSSTGSVSGSDYISCDGVGSCGGGAATFHEGSLLAVDCGYSWDATDTSCNLGVIDTSALTYTTLLEGFSGWVDSVASPTP